MVLIHFTYLFNLNISYEHIIPTVHVYPVKSKNRPLTYDIF